MRVMRRTVIPSLKTKINEAVLSKVDVEVT